MKYLWIVAAICMCLVFNWNALARQVAEASPATQQDVEKYLQMTHADDGLKQMVASMSKPMHDVVHEQFVKQQDSLPSDFEARVDKTIDDMLNRFPLDQMMEEMVKVYQKHFTQREMETLLAFYASPAGQKLLREMPAINDETMSSITPIMRENMDAVMMRIQQELAEGLQKSQQNPPAQTQ